MPLHNLQRAVDLIEAVRDSARMRHLTEGNEVNRGVIDPLDQALRAANGQHEVVLLLPMAREDAIELGDFVVEDEIRHLDPRHQFVRIGNIAWRGFGLHKRAIAPEHCISCKNELSVKDRFLVVEGPVHRVAPWG